MRYHVNLNLKNIYIYKEVRCQSEQILEIRETTKYNTEKYMNVYRMFDCFTYAIE